MSVQMAGSERPQSLLHFLVVKKRKLQELCGEGTVSLCGQNRVKMNVLKQTPYISTPLGASACVVLMRNPGRFGQLVTPDSGTVTFS